MVMQKTFKVVNVVATMNCGFDIDMDKVWKSEYILYISNSERGGPTYTAIKPPKATKQITIFYNGNMITVGNKSVNEAESNLNVAKIFLKGFRKKVDNSNGVKK